MSYCFNCHEEIKDSETLCESCIEWFKGDFESCRAVSLGVDEQIEISAIYVSLFTKEEIEAILCEHIRNNKPFIDCSEFVENDISFFCERLKHEIKKGNIIRYKYRFEDGHKFQSTKLSKSEIDTFVKKHGKLLSEESIN